MLARSRFHIFPLGSAESIRMLLFNLADMVMAECSHTVRHTSTIQHVCIRHPHQFSVEPK
jgi:hypothetical protein